MPDPKDRTKEDLLNEMLTLRQRVDELKATETGRKETEERLKRINEAFLKFGPDSQANIDRLTALCGELLKADCALYNRLEGEVLCSCGRWNTPPDFNPKDRPEGHICYDVIRHGGDDVIVVRNLPETEYARTDPNVHLYGLKTYIGKAVKFGDDYVGSLCAVYKRDYILTEEDREIIGIIASAIGIEEERSNAVEASEIAGFSIERAGDSIFWVKSDGRILYVNNVACNLFGYYREELLNMHIADISPSFSKDVWASRWKEAKERNFFTYEDEVRKKDGAFFSVEVTINYLEFKGEEYLCAYLRDITPRKDQEKDLLRREYQLEVLSRTSVHINAILEIPRIMRTLVAAAMELVGAKAGMVGLFIGGKMVFSEYNKNGTVQKIDYSFEPGRGVPGWASGKMKPYISNDVEHDPHIDREMHRALGYYNLIDAPILDRDGDVLGCVEIHNKEDNRPFDTQDLFMLQGLAASAAGALENAKTLDEQRKAEDELAQRVKFDRLITKISTRFINIPTEEVDGGINRALKEIGEFAGVDRSYIFLLSKEGKQVDNTHEWCAKGVTSQIRRLKDIAVNDFPWFNEMLMETGMVYIPRMSDIPSKAEKERAELILEEVKSIIMIRMAYGSSPIGFLGFDSVREEKAWTEEDIALLKIIGEIFANALARKWAREEMEALNKELLEANKNLRQLALKDAHTGLYNHHYLHEAIEAEFQRARRDAHPLSVIMLDIDYFKSINEVYDHRFGDLVLKQFAKHLKKMVRRYDIVVRFGGEEFIVITPGADMQRTATLAQRILDAVNLYNFGDKERTVKLKLSIAVASYPEDRAVNGIDLVNLAEEILNKVKEFGGNKVLTSTDIKREKASAKGRSREPTDRKSLRKKIEKLTKSGKQSLMESIFAFARTLELKDHYTGEHVEDTVRYATGIAKALDLSTEEMELIKEAAVLHDLGKIGISDDILRKKAKLTKKEFEEIKRHPQIGADILRPIQFLHGIIPLIFYHHERWDGKGYPSGLKGEEIPMGARIIAIADVYQALISDRPYRKAFSKEEAVRILKKGAGTQFDPKIVDIFLKILKNRKG